METYRIVGIFIFLLMWALIGGIPSLIGSYKDREEYQTYGALVRAFIGGALFGPFIILFHLMNVLDDKKLPPRKDKNHEK
jgi:RsiW-degrading membrane proteinase PrsW (M82 family)